MTRYYDKTSLLTGKIAEITQHQHNFGCQLKLLYSSTVSVVAVHFIHYLIDLQYDVVIIIDISLKLTFEKTQIPQINSQLRQL